MVTQTSMSPRIVTATLNTGVIRYNSNFAYNSHFVYNQAGSTNGNAAPRVVSAAVISPNFTSSASMKAR